MAAAASVLALLSHGCSPGPMSYPPVIAPAPPSADADAGAEQAQAALPDGCVVALRLSVTERAPLERRVEVVAENRRKEPITFELPERCPNGLVDFTGLGEGYDYYGTCTAGACFRPNSAVTITLAPGERRPLVETTLFLGGQEPCRKALPSGRFALAAVPPRGSVEICSETVIIDVPSSAPAPAAPLVVAPSHSPVAPAPALSAKPAPATPKLPPGAECSTMSDCVLSCPDAPGCCGFPCGCRNAIPRAKQAAFESGYAKSCQKPPCPAMGCAYEPAIGATCKNGRCVAVSLPSEF